jgi:hypothetical protein
MKTAPIVLALALLGLNGLSGAQNRAHSIPQPDLSNVTGVWRAEMNGLPAFNLVVTDEGGSITGAILFYLQRRVDVSHPYTATPGDLPEPIFNPKFDGKTFTFQVSHRRAHPPRTINDPPITLTITLPADGKAQFVNQSELGPITITHSDF